MREASTLCSLIDDHAALGNARCLDAMGMRANKHAYTIRERAHTSRDSALMCAHVDNVWDVVANACLFRARAVEARLTGRIADALRFEARSESCLDALRCFGTRIAR
jgi:hypothetical protein